MLFREGLQLSRVAADDRGRDLKAITRCQGELAHLALGTLRCADGVHPPGASGFRQQTLQEIAKLLHRESPELLRYVIEARSEEHTSELQSLMRISYAVLCLKKKKHTQI